MNPSTLSSSKCYYIKVKLELFLMLQWKQIFADEIFCVLLSALTQTRRLDWSHYVWGQIFDCFLNVCVPQRERGRQGYRGGGWQRCRNIMEKWLGRKWPPRERGLPQGLYFSLSLIRRHSLTHTQSYDVCLATDMHESEANQGVFGGFCSVLETQGAATVIR